MNRAKAQPASYGLDAPAVLRGLLVAAAFLMLAGWIASGRAVSSQFSWLNALGSIAFNTGLGCLCGGALMLYSSYFGKYRQRNSILGRLRLRGDETVLDVGCGRGLLRDLAAAVLRRQLGLQKH